jgi:hypothetical protein
MPRVTPEPEPELEPKPMDIHEMAAEQEIATEPEMVEEHEEKAEQKEEAKDQPDEEEYEETITFKAVDVYALQDTLDDMQLRSLILRGMHTRHSSR